MTALTATFALGRRAGLPLAQEEHHVNELPAEPWAIGVTTFLLLCLALFVVTRYNRDR